MSSIADEIRSRGHWKILIRPEFLIGRRISNIMDLGGIVETAAVHDTGWPYPACRLGKDYTIGTDWVEFGGHWDRHNETWRIHQSGQFIHYLGFFYDWPDSMGARGRRPEGKALGVLEAARTFCFVFRFCHKLAQLKLLGGDLAVSIDAQDINGRQLFIEAPERGEFHNPQMASVSSFAFETVVESAMLKDENDELAAEGVIELFRRFGWDPKPDLVLGMMPPRK